MPLKIVKNSKTTKIVRISKKKFTSALMSLFLLLTLLFWIVTNYPFRKPSPNPTPITTQLSSLSPTPILANPNPKQTSCPNGFYFYENSQYSLCYPKKLTPYLNTGVVDPADGQFEQNVITLPDTANKSELSVLPSNTAAAGKDSCVMTENVKVSGYPAVRVTKRQVMTNGCGEIDEITTIISTGKRYDFYLEYEAFVGGWLRYTNQYPVIEQSLRIK